MRSRRRLASRSAADPIVWAVMHSNVPLYAPAYNVFPAESSVNAGTGEVGERQRAGDRHVEGIDARRHRYSDPPRGAVARASAVRPGPSAAQEDRGAAARVGRYVVESLGVAAG